MPAFAVGAAGGVHSSSSQHKHVALLPVTVSNLVSGVASVAPLDVLLSYKKSGDLRWLCLEVWLRSNLVRCWNWGLHSLLPLRLVDAVESK